MNAYFLHKPDGTKLDLAVCNNCETIYAEKTLYISERCCVCRECGKPMSKDEKRTNKGLNCRPCDDRLRAEREQARLDKATLVIDYDGPVYADGVCGGSWGDGYSVSAEELSEHLDFDNYEGEHRPEFAYCCTGEALSISLDSVLQNITEEMYEDWDGEMYGVEELRAAVDKFNQDNEFIVTYNPDYTRKVAIPQSAPPVSTTKLDLLAIADGLKPAAERFGIVKSTPELERLYK